MRNYALHKTSDQPTITRVAFCTAFFGLIGSLMNIVSALSDERPVEPSIVNIYYPPEKDSTNFEDSTAYFSAGLDTVLILLLFVQDSAVIYSDGTTVQDELSLATVNSSVTEKIDQELKRLKLDRIFNHFNIFNEDKTKIEGFDSLITYIKTYNEYNLLDTLDYFAQRYRVLRKRNSGKLNGDALKLMYKKRRDTDYFENFKQEFIRRDSLSDLMYTTTKSQ